MHNTAGSETDEHHLYSQENLEKNDSKTWIETAITVIPYRYNLSRYRFLLHYPYRRIFKVGHKAEMEERTYGLAEWLHSTHKGLSFHCNVEEDSPGVF